MRRSSVLTVCLLTISTTVPLRVSVAQVQNPANGHYYEVVYNQVRWHQARWEAEQKGGHLATVSDQQEHIFLKTIISQAGAYWLGGRDEAEEGNWEWVTGEPWSYTDWVYREPDSESPDEDFLEMRRDINYRWNDQRNSQYNWYIIEYPALVLPAAISIELTPAYYRAVMSPTPTVHWLVFDVDGTTQMQYEIEVGTDDDWPTAEMWSSGIVNSSKQSAVYNGTPLSDRTSYFLRIRLADSDGFGDWVVYSFETVFNGIVIQVPQAFPTIQSGIDAAFPGDTVLVSDGVYTDAGNKEIDFGGKPIVLKSRNGPEVTVIDCQNAGRGFFFHSREDSSTVVDGFTIRSGYTGQGGGVYCSNSSPTIINNVIEENEIPDGYGGGIYCDYSDPIIINNSISGNFAFWGGGVFCDHSRPYIANNIISANAGGGVTCWFYSSPIISNNTIAGNSARWGGGIFCRTISNPAIINNTISGNLARNGGGIACLDANPIITNTIIWGNSRNQVLAAYSSYPLITYCDIQGGWEGEGNIDADPLLIGSHNRNICAQSPCIDAGDPSLLDPDGSPSDIGQFLPELAECFPGKVWHVSTTGSDTNGDGSIGHPFRTIQHGIDVSLSSDTVIVASGTYVENITIWGKSILLSSEYLFSRDTLDIMNTVINGNSVSSVVILIACDSLSGLTGFTIQGGCGYDFKGGGIQCNSSSTTISDNNIHGNTTGIYDYFIYGYGGGIHCDYSNPTIVNNTISGNTAGCGGGVYCDSSDATVTNSTISGNSAEDGGGLYCVRSNPTIINNSITDNSGSGVALEYSSPSIVYNTISGNSTGWVGGGGINCWNSNPTVINNVITANSGSGIHCAGSNPTVINNVITANSGNGIYCSYSDPTISNNTIIRNSASGGGSGIYCRYSSPVIGNTILAFSTSSSGAISCNVGSNPTLTCCDVYGNDGGDWVGCIADQESINGNFSADPLFCDTAAGDFHLSSDSPCTAGNSDCGEPIGALGFACGPLVCGDANSDGAVTIMDMLLIRAYYFTGGPSPLPLLSGDVNCSGHVDIGDIVRFADHLFRQGELKCCR